MTKRSKYKRHEKWSDKWGEWESTETGYDFNPGSKKLRRNKIDGIFGGVCAGLADYFNIDPVMVRIAYVASVLFLGVPLFIYFILWIFIPSDKRAPYIREYRQARRARRKNPENPAPTANFRDVKGKFSSLEARLQGLEKSITSSEWQLRREFRDLGS
jgi:phage shock protein C